jgi:hypothetical protein
VPNRHALAFGLVLCACTGAAAQDFDADVLQEDAFEGDPVGIGGLGDLDRVRPAPAQAPRRAEPAVAERVGEVVRAVPAIREGRHRMHVELVDGLAMVRLELSLLNAGSQPAGARYRLAVPPTAQVTSVDGGEARWIRDERGMALEVRVPHLQPRRDHAVHLTLALPAPMVGGVVRMRWPARGSDARTVPALVTVSAPGLLSPTVDGAAARDAPLPVDPWRPIEVVAVHPSGGAPQGQLWHFPCGSGRCVRARVSAGPRTGSARDLILVVDASRSTLGPARNRMDVALTSLLAMLPAGSRLRAVAFGSTVQRIEPEAVDPLRVPLARMVEASRLDLGAATRFEAVWPLVREWGGESRRARRDPLIVVVGDGGLTRSDAGTRAWAEARQAGIAVHAVNLGDGPARSALVEGVRRTGGMLVEAGDAASRAESGEGATVLEEQLAALFAPVVAAPVRLRVGGRSVALGDLRAGEELVWEGPFSKGAVLTGPGWRMSARPAPTAVAPALGERRLRMREPAPVHDVVAPVARRADDLSPPPDPLAGKGIPMETVQVMVRQRVIPAARRCLRQDRRGRNDYAVRAEYVLRLAEREVIEARVEGTLPEPLRTCLLATVDELDVPAFEGVVAIRYPIYTERAPEPPSIQLEGEVAHALDGVTAGHPADPRAP